MPMKCGRSYLLNISRQRIVLFLALGLAPHIVARNSGCTSVACIGASISHGVHSTYGHSYPDQLQELLGPGYCVHNYGVSGRTMMKYPDWVSYWNTWEFKKIVNSLPDIIIILLGSNDAKYRFWDKERFVRDYADMIHQLKKLDSWPRVYAAVPPPIYRKGVMGMNQTIINFVLPPLIREIANEGGLPPAIDVSAAFASHCPDLSSEYCHCDWMCGGAKRWGDDGCHPNNEGYEQIAKVVHAAIVSPPNRSEHSDNRKQNSKEFFPQPAMIVVFFLVLVGLSAAICSFKHRLSVVLESFCLRLRNHRSYAGPVQADDSSSHYSQDMAASFAAVAPQKGFMDSPRSSKSAMSTCNSNTGMERTIAWRCQSRTSAFLCAEKQDLQFQEIEEEIEESPREDYSSESEIDESWRVKRGARMLNLV